MLVLETIGWVGTIIILLAYFLVSRRFMTTEDKLYQLMNLTGALCIGVNVFYEKVWPVLALQIIWGLIALISLLKPRQSGSR